RVQVALGGDARAAIVRRVDEDAARLLLAADALEVDGDGALSAVARNTFGGEEAAFKLRIRGGLQPSRVGGEVNPLAHVEADAVVLSSLGAATERFVQAAAAALEQAAPPPRSRWKKLFGAGAAAGRARRQPRRHRRGRALRRRVRALAVLGGAADARGALPGVAGASIPLRAAAHLRQPRCDRAGVAARAAARVQALRRAHGGDVP